MNKTKSYIIRWERPKRDLGGWRARGPGQQQLGDRHAGAQAENNLQRQRKTFRSKKDYTTRRNGQKYRYLQTDIGMDKQWNNENLDTKKHLGQAALDTKKDLGRAALETGGI